MSSEEDESTVFRDVITNTLLGFVALVLIIVPHINPKAKAEETAKTPGNMTVEIFWNDSTSIDVDLWVQAPGDVPVGYSNKAGKIFNLLRDDLGTVDDLTERNYEFAYSRGAPPGSYTINAHLYRNNEKLWPVDAIVVVTLKRPGAKTGKQLFAKKVQLTTQGQELTVVRFDLSDNMMVVNGSVHDLPKPLRGKKQ